MFLAFPPIQRALGHSTLSASVHTSFVIALTTVSAAATIRELEFPLLGTISIRPESGSDGKRPRTTFTTASMKFRDQRSSFMGHLDAKKIRRIFSHGVRRRVVSKPLTRSAFGRAYKQRPAFKLPSKILNVQEKRTIKSFGGIEGGSLCVGHLIDTLTQCSAEE